ncbi:MAG: toluene tolerance protein [Magnetovibrio sp.]|nr:toluene tolerance protein [Magnetovibrio sp.]|tara:strand:+ start:206 stop:856 length:651 start_codon:yes stop_codon:yes gene_type:complete
MIDEQKFINSRILAFIVLTIFVTPFLVGVPAQADDTAAGAKSFIEGLADEAVKSLAAPNIGAAERRERFRKIMLQNFAFKRIARWALGRYWRRATPSERTEYLKLFENMLVIVYADRFSSYSGETLNVERSEVRGDNDILVHSKVVRSGSQKPISIAWRISKDMLNNGAFKIVDVMVEGLSMGVTQQKEFSSVIRKSGKGVQGLLEELKKRIAANS